MSPQQTRVCVVGGGPAGMMLGLLLARSGIDVTVLEKHADFFRDFRGDTIHPSTMEVLDELGMLDDLLKLPHQEIRQLAGQVGDTKLNLADFTHLPVRRKFLVIMPQWDFLNFLSEKARAYPGFHAEMETPVTSLTFSGEQVTGVGCGGPNGERTIASDLVIGADGRDSTVRQAAGLKPEDFGAPMDVLWMRISRDPHDPSQLLGRIDYGQIFVMIERGDYWQCGLVVPKGSFAEIKERGLAALRDDIRRLAPFLGDRVDDLREWNDVKLLTVQVDRLRSWHRPGLLCIGDAAHAMSPIGGVGINLAIQDAVAAANILGPALKNGGVPSTAVLEEVQKRRELPTRVTQRAQLLIQNAVITRVLGRRDKKMSPPWIIRAFAGVPLLRRIPARLVGLGFRREHVGRI